MLPNKMRLCLLAGLFAASFASLSFPEWKELHGREYASEDEHRYREVVYTKNMYRIEERNRLPGRTVTLGPTQFADLLSEEFAARFLGYKGEPSNAQTPYMDHVGVLPSSVDWVAAGAVTPVKNQGQCGSCWSFSTTGSVEGAWFLKTGDLVSLSEQQLVDCSGPEGNMGCDGGMMDQAFEYIIKNGGICSEAAYPYISAGGANGTCHTCEAVAHLSGYVDVQPNNETALMAAVAQQPVSVAVEADGLDWQFYFGGVVTDSCGTNLDHGVLVVGYGNDTTAGPFWKVKNSWSITWGEQGYIRLGRGAKFAPHGECGILMNPSYPVAA
jgi:KDEL-tailed cysteine endopeptidase